MRADASEARALRVMVVAGVKAYRDALVTELNSMARFVARGYSYSPDAADDAVEKWLADVAVVDVTSRQGIDLIACLRGRHPELAILAYGVGSKSDEILACATAGASGFVMSDASLPELAEAIDEVKAGCLHCPPSVAYDLFRMVGNREPEAAATQLTPREREVLELVGTGQSNKEIARDLGIAVSTVKNHVHHILEKSNVSSRRQAARSKVGMGIAMNRDLVPSAH